MFPVIADPMTSRVAPNDFSFYAITEERLEEIRARRMYPYYDMDSSGGMGDLQENINAHNTQINKQLTFLLPFFGFGLNYTWVSLSVQTMAYSTTGLFIVTTGGWFFKVSRKIEGCIMYTSHVLIINRCYFSVNSGICGKY